MSDRYVKSIRMTGLGDRLICLCAAWLFARATRRVLIADWRFGAYAAPYAGNQFSACFVAVDEIAGVAFIGDDRAGSLPLPRPRHPSLWDDERLLAWPFLRPPDTLFAERDDAVALIRSGGDVAAASVVFDACVNDGVVALADAQSFLRALRPAAPVAAAVRDFHAAHLHPGPVIGLHMRHGNGGDIMAHAPYWASFDAAIERCLRAVRQARAALRHDAPVLLCTDSADVQAAITSRIDGVICRGKTFRPSGDGELHTWRDAAAGRDDAMVEMLLLAACDALIRYPPGSFFSFYAAAMKPTRAAPAETVYDLQRPFDPADPLAPALLF